MLSLIAGALLMAASAYFGIGVRRVYKIRYKLFADLTGFCDYMLREVRHLKTPLSELMDAYPTGKKGLSAEILKKYSDGLRFGYGSPSEVSDKIKSVYVGFDDTLAVAGFLYGLGKGDLETELANLERYRALFGEKTAFFENELKKKGEMYYKLSVLIGITLMIIVV